MFVHSLRKMEEIDDILSMALKEENIGYKNENDDKIFEIARNERNKKLLNTLAGQHVENYFNFNKQDLEISSIWMTVKEFQNLRILLIVS